MAMEFDTDQVLHGLVGAVNNLTSDDNYKLVAGIFRQVVELKQHNQSLSSSNRDLLEEYRKFRNELEAREAEIIAAKTELEANLSAKEEELATLSKERDSLTEELSQTKEALTELQDAKAAADEELQKTKDRVDELTATEERLGKERDSLAEELSQTKEALTELQDAKAAADEELQNTKDRVDELTATEERLGQEVSQANEDKERLQTEVGKLTEESENLRTSLHDRDAELAKLKEDRDAEVAQLKDDIAKIEEEAREASSLAQERQKALESTQEELQIRSARLAEMEGFRFPLKSDPEDTYVTILDTVWTAIFELVESHFRQDLEESVLSDASCWSNLRNSEYLNQRPTRIPLPQSNTPAAKAMRIASVLAVLSRALHKHIFRPVYLVDEDAELAQLLHEAENDNPTREMDTRATLLALLPERQKGSAKKRVQTVVREVSWAVQHLLGALPYDTFCQGLAQACALACTQWRRIQEAKMKIEPYFGPPYDDFDWQVLPLAEFDAHMNGAQTPPGSDTAVEDDTPGMPPPLQVNVDSVEGGGAESGVDTDTEAPELEPDDILLVVWPSMCVVEGGELASITQGLVISKDQARSASNEVRALLGPRQTSKRARTMSIPSYSVSGSPVLGKANLAAIEMPGDEQLDELDCGDGG